MPSRFARHPPSVHLFPDELSERYQENCLSLEVPLLNSRGSTAGSSRRRRINEVERIAVRTSYRTILEFLRSRKENWTVPFPFTVTPEILTDRYWNASECYMEVMEQLCLLSIVSRHCLLRFHLLQDPILIKLNSN